MLSAPKAISPPVSDALAAVRAHATGVVRTTVSNSDGLYELPNPMPGREIQLSLRVSF